MSSVYAYLFLHLYSGRWLLTATRTMGFFTTVYTSIDFIDQTNRPRMSFAFAKVIDFAFENVNELVREFGERDPQLKSKVIEWDCSLSYTPTALCVSYTIYF